MRLTVLNSVAGLGGAAAAFLFGEWSPLLTLFLITIAIDYISGVAASLKGGRGLNSSVGFWGLAKKALMLLIISMAHYMDLVFDAGFIMNGAISFYLLNEMISITENYGRLGMPLPPQVTRWIERLKGDQGTLRYTQDLLKGPVQSEKGPANITENENEEEKQ